MKILQRTNDLNLQKKKKKKIIFQYNVKSNLLIMQIIIDQDVCNHCNPNASNF